MNFILYTQTHTHTDLLPAPKYTNTHTHALTHAHTHTNTHTHTPFPCPKANTDTHTHTFPLPPKLHTHTHTHTHTPRPFPCPQSTHTSSRHKQNWALYLARPSKEQVWCKVKKQENYWSFIFCTVHHNTQHEMWWQPSLWPNGQVFALKLGDPGIKPAFPVESYQWLKNLVLQWLPYQAPGVTGSALGLVGPESYTMTGWDGKFDLQFLSQCSSPYNHLSRSMRHTLHVARTLATKKQHVITLPHLPCGRSSSLQCTRPRREDPASCSALSGHLHRLPLAGTGVPEQTWWSRKIQCNPANISFSFLLTQFKTY